MAPELQAPVSLALEPQASASLRMEQAPREPEPLVRAQKQALIVQETLAQEPLGRPERSFSVPSRIAAARRSQSATKSYSDASSGPWTSA